MASATEIYSAVTTHYSQASTGRSSNGSYESTVARAFGYSADELASIPQNANLGLSCGNPHVLAALRKGEVVVDLGSGAGFDVFLAAPKVGPTGQAIGVDMNADMLRKAETNLANSKSELKDVVRFVNAPITDIAPLQDGSVDCVISNCVVNLVPEAEKHRVFEEMFRLLKPGGRVAISDILIRDGKDLPEHLKSDMALLVGCIAGASFVSGYERYLKEAGFRDVLIVDNHKDLNVYKADDTMTDTSQGGSGCKTSSGAEQRSCCGTKVSGTPNGANANSSHLNGVDFNSYAGSYNIYAVKAL